MFFHDELIYCFLKGKIYLVKNIFITYILVSYNC